MNYLIKISLSVFLFTIFIYTDLTAQPFVDLNAGLIGLNVGSAAWGDYDNDGDLDILINGYDGIKEYSIVYRNDNGTFVDINAGLIPAAYGSAVAWGDYDNDGDLDILLSGRIDNVNRISKIYRNDNGNFIDINSGLAGLSGSCVAWGDYDNDGDLDIIITGWDGSTRNTKIYRNDNGVFTDVNVSLVGVTLGTVTWGDYDSDGDLDILLTGLDNTLFWNAKVYRNDNGIFTDINANLEEVDGSSAAWGDYDSDGDLDIVLSGRTSFGVYSRIYRNDSGYFININANIVDVYESSNVWGDYDNDGDFDLLLCGYDYTMIYANLYRNDNGNFVNINAGLSGIRNRNGAAWGDYDNDGDLDILLSGNNGSSFITKIYRNDNITTNTIPVIPSNLSSIQAGLNEITLSWNKSTDNETSQHALTYNLRIGTAPGSVDIFSPMANLNNGYRKIPALGNSNHDTSWTIKNLPEGTYYWSVQAIDNCFAGSDFAQEDSFNISPQTFPLFVSILDGWNMVSVPGVNTDGQGVDNWWSGRIGDVFKYSSGYQIITTTIPGEGYWMKHLGVNEYNTGDEWPIGGIEIVAHDPIIATTGWNLIGGYEDVVATSNLTTTPPGLITGSIYEYGTSGYTTAASLVPGYGYWVKILSPGGVINIPDVLARGSAEIVEWFKDDWGKIIITDAAGRSYTLYIVNEEVDLVQYELPPMPPAGMFDIRFGSGRLAEDINSAIQTIEMTGIEHPITVKVEDIDIRLYEETGKEINENVKRGEEIVISNPQVTKLVVTGKLMPDTYTLEQNYPNPFNPSTKISWQSPVGSHQTLKVYDVLGNEIATLVDEYKPAGSYEVEWNATGLPSGIYFYQLRTEGIVKTKKMILLK